MKKTFHVVLPNGKHLPATESKSAQEASAKAMMMDIPPGCRVEIKTTNR